MPESDDLAYPMPLVVKAGEYIKSPGLGPKSIVDSAAPKPVYSKFEDLSVTDDDPPETDPDVFDVYVNAVRPDEPPPTAAAKLA